MKKPMLVGKLAKWDICHCCFCSKDTRDGYSSYNNFETKWLCKNCINKLKYKKGDKIYFIKWNRNLEKLQIVKGNIHNFSSNREMTYRVMYDDPVKYIDVKEDYISKFKLECKKIAKKLGEVADDKLIADLEVMKLQGKLYDDIKKFLNNNLAREFDIVGIDVNLENGYVNATWKFKKGSRKKNDIKE